MPNEPKPAAQKRTPPASPRRNGQDDPEGSPHRPEEFDSMNPAKLDPDHPIEPDHRIENVEGVQREGFYGSQSWEATSPGEQAEERGPTAPEAERPRSGAGDGRHPRSKSGNS